MKNLIIATALTMAMASSAAWAGVADVEPTADTIKPSTVEQIYNLQKETNNQPGIRLVKVDNGGSSDISSHIQPSRLYLGLHHDGEEFNVDGNYLLSMGVVEVLSAKMTSATEVSLKFKSRKLVDDQNGNERVRELTESYTLFLSDVLKEEATAHANDSSFEVALKSPVGMKSSTP